MHNLDRENNHGMTVLKNGSSELMSTISVIWTPLLSDKKTWPYYRVFVSSVIVVKPETSTRFTESD